jgi:hypothetical protein
MVYCFLLISTLKAILSPILLVSFFNTNQNGFEIYLYCLCSFFYNNKNKNCRRL